MNERLYKILKSDGTPCHGGSGKWSLPAKNADGTWTPGEWMPATQGEIIPCENGYHLCQEQDLLNWLNEAIFEAEYRGELVEAEDKVVVREARLLHRLENWNERTARLFACDCAERVLHLFEDKHPEDKRPRQAIEIARKFANGEATQEELAAAWDAAGNAAWAVAGNAAWDASWDAARAAAGNAAWDASWDAAGNAAWAAWDAAWDARDAARAVEKQWQTARLMEYLNGTIAD